MYPMPINVLEDMTIPGQSRGRTPAMFLVADQSSPVKNPILRFVVG